MVLILIGNTQKLVRIFYNYGWVSRLTIVICFLDDRGGKKEDYKNYVSLVREMRKAFGKRSPSWDISMAIPASYWYLQHFDISALEPEVSWFNLMR